MTLKRHHVLVGITFTAGAIILACSDDRPRAAGGSSGFSSGGTSSGTSGASGTSGTSGTSGASGGDSGSKDGSSEGGSSGAIIDAGNDAIALQCVDVPREGAVVTQTRVAQAMPAFNGGGPFAPGKYYLISWTEYTGVGGATGPTQETRKTTLIIGNGLIRDATSEDGQEDPIRASQYSTNGNMLSQTVICPFGGSTLPLVYSYANDELSVVPFGTNVFVFKKQ